MSFFEKVKSWFSPKKNKKEESLKSNYSTSLYNEANKDLNNSSFLKSTSCCDTNTNCCSNDNHSKGELDSCCNSTSNSCCDNNNCCSNDNHSKSELDSCCNSTSNSCCDTNTNCCNDDSCCDSEKSK